MKQQALETVFPGRDGVPEQPNGSSAGAPSQNGSGGPAPQVIERAKRRRFKAEYKARIVREADRSRLGEIGALLRREGLYSSHLTAWRKQLRQHGLEGLKCGSADLHRLNRGPKTPALQAEIFDRPITFREIFSWVPSPHRRTLPAPVIHGWIP